jgi:uncharacterized iron-regulated membrane protein
MALIRLDPRGFWFTVHQWTGLFCLAFLIIVGATGSILSFRPQLDRWLNPSLFDAPARGAARPIDALVSAVETQRPGLRVSQVLYRVTPGRAAVMSVEPSDRKAPAPGYDQVFVDPVTGRILGQRSQFEPGWSPPELLYGVHQMHAELVAGNLGRWLLGVVSGLWALSSLIGLYLTLPKARPFWKKWKAVWTVKLGSKLPRILLDLHRASGLWLLLAAVPVAVTGCALNFYYEVTEPAAIALSPSRTPQMNEEVAPPSLVRPRTVSFGRAAEIAADLSRKDGPALTPAIASYEADEGLYRVGVTRSGQRDYVGYGPVYYYLSGADGALAYMDNPYNDSAGRGFIRGLYPVHSGEVGGWPTRIIVFLLGLVVVEMSVSGLYVWWKKQAIKAKGRRAQAAAARA